MRLLRGLAATILLGVVAPVPAHAAEVYAYWSYWQGDAGTWRYATVGPTTSPAVDGAVDGWRFTLGADGRATQPTTPPDFQAICGGTARPEGSVRVALVLDFGGLGDGVPVPRCAVVEEGLSRASALTAVAALRLRNGFVCAIDNRPETGCGDAVGTGTPATPTPTASATTTPASPAPTTSATTASDDPTAAPTVAPTTSTAPAVTSATTDSMTQVGAEGSPLATVLTFVLGGIAVALAVRNGRRQMGQR